MFTVWITVGTIIILIEWVLWSMFLRKAAGLSFPHNSDESLLRFFTVTRLRLVAMLHTLFLIAVFVLTTSFLW